MLVEQRLGKAIAYFAGGFGFAKLDEHGEYWNFTVKRPIFTRDNRMVLQEGKFEAYHELIKTQGLKHGFEMARGQMGFASEEDS